MKKAEDEEAVGDPDDDADTSLRIYLMEAHDLPAADANGKSDPYCKFYFSNPRTGQKSVKKTSNIVSAQLNPVWDQIISLPFSGDFDEELHVEVYDHDRFSADDFLGKAIIPMTIFKQKGPTVTGWFNLSDSDEATRLSQGSVNLRLNLGGRFLGQKGPRPHDKTDAKSEQKTDDAANTESKVVTVDGELRENISVWVGTWNVGNNVPPEDLSPWIPPEGHDIYVIGAQECNYKTREDMGSCNFDWGATLIRHFVGITLVSSTSIFGKFDWLCSH